MANSRLERLGTIYSRVSGLLRANAMKAEDKPIWFDIYAAFPPDQEPSYSYKPPETTINPIFYTEDKVRSKFHKTNADLIGIVNLGDATTPTACQEFLSIYKKIAQEKPEGNVYEEALDVLKTSREQIMKAESHKSSDKDSLASSFRRAKEKTKTETASVDMKNIFDS